MVRANWAALELSERRRADGREAVRCEVRGVRSKLETARCMHSRARDANWFKLNSTAFSQDFKTSSGRSSLCQLSCGSYITGESTLERQTLFRYFTEERSRECGLTLASCKKKRQDKRRGVRGYRSIPSNQTIRLNSAGAKRKKIRSADPFRAGANHTCVVERKEALPGRTLVASSGACHQS